MIYSFHIANKVHEIYQFLPSPIRRIEEKSMTLVNSRAQFYPRPLEINSLTAPRHCRQHSQHKIANWVRI